MAAGTLFSAGPIQNVDITLFIVAPQRQQLRFYDCHDDFNNTEEGVTLAGLAH